MTKFEPGKTYPLRGGGVGEMIRDCTTCHWGPAAGFMAACIDGCHRGDTFYNWEAKTTHSDGRVEVSGGIEK